MIILYSFQEEAAHLTVQAKQDDHNEKEYGPQLRNRHHGNCSRVGNERQAGACSMNETDERNTVSAVESKYCCDITIGISFCIHNVLYILTWLCHFWYVCVLLICHESKYREDGKARYKTGSTVQKAQVHSVPGNKKERKKNILWPIIWNKYNFEK